MNEEIHMPEGEYELKLRILQADALEICTVTLFSCFFKWHNISGRDIIMSEEYVQINRMDNQ